MPLLSTFLDSMNCSNKISANLRYCDCAVSRHTSSGNTCAFASPSITSLVPEDLRHQRVRNGIECSHFSFNAIRGASLKARINKRFESIDNDRQENMVDILNSINEKSGNSSDFLRMIVSKIDSEGTACKLLKTISDAFRNEGSMSEMSRNTSLIAEYAGHLSNDSQQLKEDLNGYHLENKTLFQNAFDKLIQLNSYGLENLKLMNTIGTEINSKIGSIAESVAIKQSTSVSNIETNIQEITTQLRHVLDVSGLSEFKEKVDSNEIELSSVKYELQLLGTLFEKNGVENSQEFNEIKREMREIKEEIHLLREAITDVLPNKLIDAFKLMTDHYSFDGSELELVDSEINE